MEIINNANGESLTIKYTPTIKDNSLNWFQIEANKTTTKDTTIWRNSLFADKGVTGVYNTITPLTIASYVSIDQLKQEAVLAKLIQAKNGEERSIMLIVGNRQLKAMQENGTIYDILQNTISVYNSKGLCGRRSLNLNKAIINTYIDEHGNTRYYWQDYCEFTNKGVKWSIKALLNEFYIKVDNFSDAYIYTPQKDFIENTGTSVQRIIFTAEKNNGAWTLKNNFEIVSPNNIAFLNVVTTREWGFRTTGGGHIYMIAIAIGYDIKVVFPNADNICLLRADVNYMHDFTIDDYIGGFGVVIERNENGVISKKITGQSLQGREIEIKKDDYFIAIDVYSLYQLIGVNGATDLTNIVPEYASYYNNISTNTPYVNNTDIRQYLPKLDILQILRIYQYCLNTDITIDEYNTMQTSIVPINTELKYYPIISYTQKFDSFGALKAKKNYIKIEAGENTEEEQILDIDLSTANVLDIDTEADIITLPSFAYYDKPTTHTAKTYTRCYEVEISINYADFKNNLTYISFFGQKARVLNGQYNENETAKLIILL